MNTQTLPNTIASVATTLVLALLLTASASAQNTILTNRFDSGAPTDSEIFERTLRQFVKMAAKDQTVCSLLSKHAVTLEYTVSDHGLRCYVGFNGKTVESGFGKPARPPELEFQSTAQTLDRVLRGEDEQSDMQVSVHLSLVRKISLKLDLKQIRSALARVYTNASDTVTSRNTMLAQTEKPMTGH